MKYLPFIMLLALPIFGSNLEITSKDFFYKDGDNKATFSGNAVAKEQKNLIKSDKIVVFLDNNSEAEKYKAIGNVYFELVNSKKDINGTCDTLTYLPKPDKYILQGKVVINDRKTNRKVFGDEIIIDNKKGTSYANSKSNKPVKFIFKVKSSK
jgi:lipopolysaccharide export system protein LptA